MDALSQLKIVAFLRFEATAVMPDENKKSELTSSQSLKSVDMGGFYKHWVYMEYVEQR